MAIREIDIDVALGEENNNFRRGAARGGNSDEILNYSICNECLPVPT
jgi:hypothetical protein